MLNARVEKHFKNEQYQVLVRAPGPAGPAQYEFRSECSIQFEVDGPYRVRALIMRRRRYRALIDTD